MNVAIIPARGGSVRIPRKNLRLFHGEPIIAYSIASALASGQFASVVVSTDDDEIDALARSLGASIVRRDASLSDDHVGTQAVMADALKKLRNRSGISPDQVCCLYATAPLVLASDLQSAVAMFADPKNGRLTFSYTVGPDGKDAGAFYYGTPEEFGSDDALTDAATAKIVLPAERVCDINTEDDWLRAEQMYAALHGSPPAVDQQLFSEGLAA